MKNSASKDQPVNIKTRRIANVVDPKLAKEMLDFRIRLSAQHAGFSIIKDWHPALPKGWGEFQQLPVTRATVFRGDDETRAYNHHQTITKFGDKYVASWSSGFLNEDFVGQEVHFAWSRDAIEWSKDGVVAPTPVESNLVRNNVGLYASGGRLYCYVGVAQQIRRDVADVELSIIKELRLEVYSTTDLKNWKQLNSNIGKDVYLFEGPRETLDGKLMCCGWDLTDHHGKILIWDDASRPDKEPRMVRLEQSKDGVLPIQGTWYQTQDHRIWAYFRDDGLSCRLGLTWSDDGGDNWADLVYTDFPNTYSRAYAGKLADGRYFIVGNNYDILLNRRHMLIALSNDGRKFDRQYTLLQTNATRRVNGRHKEDGCAYPNCYVDGNKLLTIYSVNKEDIEVSTVDTTAFK